MDRCHESSTGHELRLALIIYLLLISTHEIFHAELQEHKERLEADIIRLRDRLLRNLPLSSSSATQCLLLLCHMVPLGILPCISSSQEADIEPQRGVLDALVKSCPPPPWFNKPMNPDDPDSLLELPDLWMQLQRVSLSMSEELEGESPQDHPDYRMAVDLARSLFEGSAFLAWAERTNPRGREDLGRLIGRLEILERLIRIDIVMAALISLDQLPCNEIPHEADDWLSTVEGQLSKATEQLDKMDHRLHWILSAYQRRYVRRC